MDKVRFEVNQDTIRSYSRLFDLRLSDTDIDDLSSQLPAVLEGISQLWDIDVTGAEMSVVFPVDC